MKALITFLLVLTASQGALAKPRVIHSRVCNYDYTEGVKVRRASGQIIRECIHKARLGELYATDSESECDRGFVPGIRVAREGDFTDKLCLHQKSLGEVYETDAEYPCAKVYVADLVTLYNYADYPSIYCIRN